VGASHQQSPNPMLSVGKEAIMHQRCHVSNTLHCEGMCSTECFSCGSAACKNCSKVVPTYMKWRNKRICRDCDLQHAGFGNYVAYTDAGKAIEKEKNAERAKQEAEKKQYEHLKGCYAFWAYDLFPFLLHGRIVGSRLGLFKIDGYGDYLFKPSYILPPDKGKELARKLNTMKLERDTQIGRVNRAFNAQRTGIVDLLELYNKKA
jgi:hypothetical protein